jgi:hypothetical protein
MQPSETEHGRRWLSNFAEDDRSAASLLLDSLDFVGQNELRAGLQQLIESLAKEIPTPIGLVPVRELAPDQSYYKTTNRNAKPPLLLSTSFPGSEAIVANIAGSLRRQRGNAGPFVSSPSLRNLREARAKSILYIDDFSGSGGRLIKFHKQFRRHPTIRSWESYGLINYHVAAYAMTRSAYDRLTITFGSDNIHIVRICPTFSNQNWTSLELYHVERVCREYASDNLEEYALGYNDSRGLMVFSHSAPNNLPTILWQLYFGVHWEPFFSDKAIPIDLMPLFDEPTYEIRLKSSLRRLGQSRLAEGDWRHEASPRLTNVLLVLAAIARRARNEIRIAELTGLSHREISAIIESCRHWNLVGSKGLHLTDKGLSELRHAKGISLSEERVTLKGSTEFYYPRSLRVGR